MIFGYSLLLFVTIPLVELMLLIKLFGVIGFPYTIGLVLLTGLVGYSLAKWQGLEVVQSIHNEIQAGRMPTDRMLDGIMILLAAGVLLTPGILTDIAGFLLLTPRFRVQVKKWLATRMVSSVEKRSVSTFFFSTKGAAPFSARRPDPTKVQDDDVIDV